MSYTLVRPETEVCIDYVESKSNGLHWRNILVRSQKFLSVAKLATSGGAVTA